VAVPADLTVDAQSSVGAVVGYAASAFDAGNRAIPVTCVPASGSMFPLATTTVSCSATADGQTTASTFRITVVDRAPPVLRVPAKKTVRTTRTRAVVVWTAAAFDIVDGPVPTACTPRSGTRFRVGRTTVTCAAVDLRNNADSAKFSVNVVLVRTTKQSRLFSPPGGARVSGPPLLRWRAVPRASFYNVQVYRAGRKIVTVWPRSARFGMRRTWTFRGRTLRLTPGKYTWYVWPAFGRLASPRYGKMLGQSSFRMG
jgi:hypothetical protein